MNKITLNESDICEMVMSAILLLINEDVFANKSLLNKKSKTVGLTYNHHAGRNVGNLTSMDMLNTEKMEKADEDTYEVTLKGGITSYNITSIKGEAVMHYFKNKFSNGGDSAKIKAGKDEYDIIMEDSEFKKFMDVFNTKVNRVINYCIGNFKKEGNEFVPSKVSIYPVPSRSNFNKTMAEILSRMSLGGLPVRVANADILKKDLRRLQKDEDFISKNKEYFSGKMSQQSTQNGFDNPVSSFLDRDISKFTAMNNAKQYIEEMNIAVSKILAAWQNYKQSNSQKTLESLVKNYKAYYDAMKKCVSESGYESPINTDGGESNLRMDTIAKALKYTKGPSVEGRSGFIWELVKPNLRGTKSEVTGKPYTKVDINRWEPQKFEIKNLTNGERMGLRNYYNPNEDFEFIQNELNEIKGGVLVIFDDNISGGATLSDVCYQFKDLGVEYLIPITFGKMSTKWTMNMIPLSRPTNNKGEFGKFNY